jgi:4-hydroxymandelate oxidase
MLLSVDDYRKHAQKVLPEPIFDYVDGGAVDCVSLRENALAYGKLFFVPRVFVDVSHIDLNTTVVGGVAVTMPILIAPTAAHRLVHDKGELETARAAVRTGTVMTLSSVSSSRVEDCAFEMRQEQARLGQNGPLPLWFQLYVLKDQTRTQKLVRNAEAAGCSALVITVDVVVPGIRENNVRNKFRYPSGVNPVLFDELFQAGGKQPSSDDNTLLQTLFDDTLTWSFLDTLRTFTRLPLIVKGVLSPQDAARAASLGVSAVVVSNHGGRQQDSAVPTILALPGVVRAVKAVNPQCAVYVDGGIRRGGDVAKALALGADAVFVGRAVLWGLAHSGAEGACAVLELLRAELRSACALNGVTSIKAAQAPGLVTTQEKLLAAL